MTNLEALSAKCTRICSGFYPDRKVLEDALFDAGIGVNDEAIPKDVRIVTTAIELVVGYVEQSRSEGGVAVSVNEDAVKQSIIFHCDKYGLDTSRFVKISSIENGSSLW